MEYEVYQWSEKECNATKKGEKVFEIRDFEVVCIVQSIPILLFAILLDDEATKKSFTTECLVEKLKKKRKHKTKTHWLHEETKTIEACCVWVNVNYI